MSLAELLDDDVRSFRTSFGSLCNQGLGAYCVWAWDRFRGVKLSSILSHGADEAPADLGGLIRLIPQNKRFIAQDSPNYLKCLQPQLKFVWIDLFCIPQGGSCKADEEINR